MSTSIATSRGTAEAAAEQPHKIACSKIGRFTWDELERVVLVSNTAWYLFNFRLDLLRTMRDSGVQVTVAAPRDDYVPSLQREGLGYREWSVDRSFTNPLRDYNAMRRLADIYGEVMPQLVHHFTIKPVLYGTLAAQKHQVPYIVNSVTGLGHIFTSGRLWAVGARPLIRRWYRHILSANNGAAIFQNADDLHELAGSAQKIANGAIITRGSGVDLTRFGSAGSEASTQRPEHGPLRVLYVGRLLREKGIYELLQAVQELGSNDIEIELELCGAIDSGNPSSLAEEEVDGYANVSYIRFDGHVNDIERRMAAADVVVLPSYREGTPRVLLEAAAMGKALIATDVPGCREVVRHEETGLLAKPRNVEALKQALKRLHTTPALRGQLGTAAQEFVRQHFDERRVTRQTLSGYNNLMIEKGLREERSKARQPGTLVVSLDLELAWGTRGRPAARYMKPFLQGAREAIELLLQLFEEHHIPATWAVVGGLMLGRGAGKKHEWLREACYDDIPAGDCVSHPYWYGDDIIEQLLAHPVPQELGCHTLTHLYVQGGAEGRAQLARELERSCQLFHDLSLPAPRSFIFPKAMMAHVDLLGEYGFRSFRGPESQWCEQAPGKVLPAALRLLDGSLGVSPRVDPPALLPNGMWMIPASQFYAPHYSVGRYVSVNQRVRKAMAGLHTASERGGIYHLWTHPFNLGVRTGPLIEGLRQIFAEARQLADRGQLQILSMGELASHLSSQGNIFGESSSRASTEESRLPCTN